MPKVVFEVTFDGPKVDPMTRNTEVTGAVLNGLGFPDGINVSARLVSVDDAPPAFEGPTL